MVSWWRDLAGTRRGNKPPARSILTTQQYDAVERVRQYAKETTSKHAKIFKRLVPLNYIHRISVQSTDTYVLQRTLQEQNY